MGQGHIFRFQDIFECPVTAPGLGVWTDEVMESVFDLTRTLYNVNKIYKNILVISGGAFC